MGVCECKWGWYMFMRWCQWTVCVCELNLLLYRFYQLGWVIIAGTVAICMKSNKLESITPLTLYVSSKLKGFNSKSIMPRTHLTLNKSEKENWRWLQILDTDFKGIFMNFGTDNDWNLHDMMPIKIISEKFLVKLYNGSKFIHKNMNVKLNGNDYIRTGIIVKLHRYSIQMTQKLYFLSGNAKAVRTCFDSFKRFLL